MSVFDTLYQIDVSEKIEKKNGLSFLPWAWAWAECKKRYPAATYTIYESSNGMNYHTDGRTAWVKTGVTIEGIEHIEYLPVMNNTNKSIPLNSITSFDVNKTIQRSLTKALARHGLGLCVYAGEDLPEQVTQPQPQPKPALQFEPAGGEATPEERKELGELFKAKYADGTPVFTKDEAKAYSDQRRTKTARQLIEEIRAELNRRLNPTQDMQTAGDLMRQQAEPAQA